MIIMTLAAGAVASSWRGEPIEARSAPAARAPAVQDLPVPRGLKAEAEVKPASIRVASPRPRVDRCDARRPRGYRRHDGYPSRAGTRNPQEAALYLQAALTDRSTTRAQKSCIVKEAADAVLRTAVARDGALLLPYSSRYDAGAAGMLRAPWFSGLAQTTMMGSLLSVARVTGDAGYERAARATFEALCVRSGLVQPVGGGAWIQEYPTATPSYVLNGHLFSIMSARSFGEATGDPRGADLFAAGVRSTASLLPLFDVPTPAGPVSAYDLVRRVTGAEIRVTGATVDRAEILDAAGRATAGIEPASLRHGLRPRYPVSVVASPRVFVRIEHRGHGAVEVRDGDRWLRLASLGASPATVEIPQRFQGRTINMRYHRMHGDLLRRLAHASGNPEFSRWADRWSR